MKKSSLQTTAVLQNKIQLHKRVSIIKRAWKWKEQLWGYVFLLPSLVLFSIFLFYPLFKSVYLSLFITDAKGQIVQFVGLQNFTNLLLSSSFYNSLKVTGLFVLYTVPSGILFSLILAGMTHQSFRGTKWFQFIFSLPVAVSVGTASVIWLLLFHPSTGTLNYFLSLMGQEPIFWLSDPKWALISVSIMTVWMNTGFNYIVLLSGMKQIPTEILESAKMDGSGELRTFFQIKFPLLSPTLFFLVIISVIQAFQAFGQIHILTKGGPMQVTNTFVYEIYQDAFVNYRFGEGSAQALILFLIIMLLTWIQFKWLERKVHYQ